MRKIKIPKDFFKDFKFEFKVPEYLGKPYCMCDNCQIERMKRDLIIKTLLKSYETN